MPDRWRLVGHENPELIMAVVTTRTGEQRRLRLQPPPTKQTKWLQRENRDFCVSQLRVPVSALPSPAAVLAIHLLPPVTASKAQPVGIMLVVMVAMVAVISPAVAAVGLSVSLTSETCNEQECKEYDLHDTTSYALRSLNNATAVLGVPAAKEVDVGNLCNF
jgi:hypothetical protein